MLDLRPSAYTDVSHVPTPGWQAGLSLAEPRERAAARPPSGAGQTHARERRHAPVGRGARAIPPPPGFKPRLCIPSRRLSSGWQVGAKRVLDIAGALFGLAVLGVMLPVIAWAILRDSPGPVLFRQTRMGLRGQTFRMVKFRTMRRDVCEPNRCQQVRRGDPRVTRAGAWLRRTSLDEWPQFINVLRGEMSIVGPRPHAAGSRAGERLFEEVTHRYPARHQVKPGMTGLAQIRGLRGETDTEDKLIRRVDADIEYIETWSIWLDVWIIWRTIVALPRMPNAH